MAVLAFLVTLALAALIVLLFYKYLTWHYNVWQKLGLPGPRPSVFCGNFPSISTAKQHICYDFDDIYQVYKKSNRAVGVYVGRNPEIMILDPKLANEIMVTKFRNYHDNLSSKWIVDSQADKFAARNPFFMAGDAWKEKRSEVMGGLTLNKMNLAYPIWKESALKLRKFLQEKSMHDKEAMLNTKDLAYRFIADIVGDFLWGIDAGSFVDNADSHSIYRKTEELINGAFEGAGYRPSQSLLPFVKSGVRVFPERTDKFFSQLTKDAMAMRLNDKKSADRADFLSYVMQLQEKRGISHDDAVGHILTVVLDGYETAALVLVHTLFYLAHHLDVQEKLRAELSENMNTEDDFMTFDKLNNLPFLEQCVNETMRMISPLPLFSKICTEATEMELGDNNCIPIKVGTIVTIPVFSYHHDPEYFPQPYQYKPERFDNGAHLDLAKRGVLMPFGDGPRICLGMRMALLEIKVGLAEILARYRVKSCLKTMAEKRPDSNGFIFGLDGEFILGYERLY